MKYPNNILKAKKDDINYANRGMGLEDDINVTNEYYDSYNIAVIHKKPTPIRIVKVTFNQEKKAKICEAYFQAPSTTDYNGIYKEKYIDFEAKEVRGHCFPLGNINAHQVQHISKIIQHGGICFLIVRFSLLNKTFVLKGTTLLSFIEEQKRKSIPLSFFSENGFQIKEAFTPRLDYLSIIDKIYFGGQDEKEY